MVFLQWVWWLKSQKTCGEKRLRIWPYIAIFLLIMTTNHRPTLESKRGKVQAIGDLIAHKRALPLQTLLKSRRDGPSGVDEQTGKNAVEELKRELLARESAPYDSTKRLLVDLDGVAKRARLNTPDDGETAEIGTGGESSDGSENDDSDGSLGSDSEDMEELMAELAKIKEEKRLQKLQKEKEDALERASSSNPLVLLTDEKPVKKSWRSETTFSGEANLKPLEEDFTNDTLKSDHHKQFLSKYVR